MDADTTMYYWRRLTPKQRRQVLQERRRHPRAWHGPPHYADDSGLYLLSAACYEHRAVIGVSSKRMADFESELLANTQERSQTIFAWIVLPNHYHLLVHAPDIKGLLKALGQLHGRTSFRWNDEDCCRGRQVWHRVAETAMKSERHFWASLNYVLHNAVHHSYAERWQDWPYSNAAQYLEAVGRDEAERRWRAYPILDYGKTWDPPDL
jgi:putative transposase